MYTEKIVLYRSYKSRSDIKLSAESELTLLDDDKRIGIGERALSAKKAQSNTNLFASKKLYHKTFQKCFAENQC